MTVFAVYAAAAVFFLAGITATIAITLLDEGQALGDHDLAVTATPLIIGAWLLILVNAFTRVATLAGGIGVLAPLAGSAVVVAVGALLAGLIWCLERFMGGSSRRGRYRHLAKFAAAGFVPAPTTLRILSKSHDLVVVVFRSADGGHERRLRFERGELGTYDVTDLVAKLK